MENTNKNGLYNTKRRCWRGSRKEAVAYPVLPPDKYSVISPT